MAFSNPFNRVKTLDDKGYLRLNVRKFLDLEGRPTQFYDAINHLQNIREGLIVAQETGLSQQLNNGFNYYKMAINWLQLNNPINQGVAVSAVASYDDINDSIAQSFLQFVDWFRNNYLANDRVYQNIQTQLGVQKADKLRALELQADSYEQEFKTSLYEAQTHLAESADERTRELEKTLSDTYNSQLQAIQDAKLEAVGEIKQAQSLTIWHESYERNITIYEQKLYGIKWVSLELANRIKNLSIKRLSIFNDTKKSNSKNDLDASRNESKVAAKAILYLSSLLRFLWKVLRFSFYMITRSLNLAFICLSRVLVFALSKLVISLRAQRSLWFLVLGVVLIGQSLVFLHLIINGSMEDIPILSVLDPDALASLVSNDYILAKVSIFLGLVLVPSLGYAFANRNYRIYSNLLEQYRHRATVAQTLQGVLRYVDESENNKDIRMSLTAVAAVAMFEMKNVGHLTKKDADTLPMAEILNSVMKK